MRLLVHPLEVGLAGERDERRAVEVGVGDRGDQVQRARPERARGTRRRGRSAARRRRPCRRRPARGARARTRPRSSASDSFRSSVSSPGMPKTCLTPSASRHSTKTSDALRFATRRSLPGNRPRRLRQPQHRGLTAGSRRLGTLREADAPHPPHSTPDRACSRCPPAPAPRPAGSSRARGWGHGIGMSQYGAYGMAQDGSNYREILAHYYTGTEVGPAPTRRRSACCSRRTATQVTFTGAIARGRQDARRRADLRRARRGRRRRAARQQGQDGRHVRRAAARSLGRDGCPAAAAPRSTASRTAPTAAALELRPSARRRADRGQRRRRSTTTCRASCPGEMPSSWHPEALKAQVRRRALATRSPPTRGGPVFDQYPDTRSQVYRGVTGEASSTNAAVRATAGEVVKLRRQGRRHLLLLDLGRPHRERRERLLRRRARAVPEGRRGPDRRASRPSTAGRSPTRTRQMQAQAAPLPEGQAQGGQGAQARRVAADRRRRRRRLARARRA